MPQGVIQSSDKEIDTVARPGDGLDIPEDSAAEAFPPCL
jgi:hypothetical protein